ncbi:MAG TPA: hypothetical protein VG056_09790 [Pirellulales bacterium]|nr:hypothetical protein [Pirellulales bacterium]
MATVPCESPSEQRMALVDALRGLAALWVAAYHFHAALLEHNQSLHASLSWPARLQQMLSIGDRGVE